MCEEIGLLRRRRDFRLLINDSDESKKPGPIIGYAQEPLLPLDQACKPLVDIIHDILTYATEALNHTPIEPADDLTRDESASIRLYTMEWIDEQTSLYSVLNHTLKSADRGKLQPWFKYLKLLLTALAKIPCTPLQTVWRGVRKNISDAFPPGEQVIWWSCSSCTTNLTVLKNNLYLGDQGDRTLFSIELFNGRSIRAHSQFDVEDEILMLPGTYMEVQSQFNPAPDLCVIHLKQKIPKQTLLELPFKDACLYPEISTEILMQSSKRRWHQKPRFFVSISLMVVASLIAIILGSIFGLRSTVKTTETTTSPCPTNAWNTCVFTTRYELESTGYYGLEFVDIDCNQALSNITVVITVQRTLGASFTKQYNSYPSNTLIETSTQTSSQIFYVWVAKGGQIIDFQGSPYNVEAQFQLQGASQMISKDTYSVIAQVACNGEILTKTGHF